MPRRRKLDPTIPKHIDQGKLPVGIYWNRRDSNWYTITAGKRSKPVAGKEAMLSDLHAAMEISRGVDASTLDYMLGLFEESTQFLHEIKPATQDDYRYCRKALQRHKTKVGVTFANLRRSMMTMPLLQRLIDDIAKDAPSKANHVARYLSVAFQWGLQRGYVQGNPAKGLRKHKERKAHRMPEADTMKAVIAFLRVRGAYVARREGAVPPYAWAVATLAYFCRMRSVEVRMLTDASLTPEGIHVVRVKGSNDNITLWCPELREACDWLKSRRARIWLDRPSFRTHEPRPLVVAEDGSALSKSALNSAWRRAMAVAIAEKIIPADARFGLHGLKHRGITDTPAEHKRAAGGHKTEAMASHYDHELRVVDPAGRKL